MPWHSENAWNTSEESKTLRILIHQPHKMEKKEKNFQHESVGVTQRAIGFYSPALEIVKRHPR